ncbi:MAG: cyclic nucleotide-binding/CBS domain-containing protein [Candidatus Competibacteraceae bacterium]|nr:cyclic nucleotide-binding/CBS domain-containing protein [Candidatus Competibacteraceae bacterium]
MAQQTDVLTQLLATTQPFDSLPPEIRQDLQAQIEIRACPTGTVIIKAGETNHFLRIVLSGQLELHQPDGVTASTLGESAMFGYRTLLGSGQASYTALAVQDSQIGQIPAALFLDLCQRFPSFKRFFQPMQGNPAQRTPPLSPVHEEQGTNLLTTPLPDLLLRKPITLPSHTSIRKAAELMAEQRISSMLVVDEGKLSGIVTDRDLRIRVIAAGRSYDEPLSSIMTRTPVTVQLSAFGFEALLAMARSNVHHVPVMDGERVAGMVTATDLLERRASSAVYLVSDVYNRSSGTELAKVSARLPLVLRNLVESNATARSAGHVISAVAEAITCRLLQLAEQKLGPPPVKYAWLAAGSLARGEQTALSDQDNCLLLADDYQAAQHGDYFDALSRFVCDGLDECGYIYCPGDVMAMNPEWRQPLAQWKRYFNRWIEQPEPKALMLSSVFFDMRLMYGDADLLHDLQQHVLAKSKANRIFLAYMASNSLGHQPPLGLFRNFVLIKGGENNHTLDLKHNGVVPIIDLARIYSLAAGLTEINTWDRLEAAGGLGELSEQGAADLRDALEFISAVRLRHQVRRIRQQLPPNNFVPPDQLSHFERNHLKDAFALVRTMQSVLGQRFQSGRLG